MRVVTYRNDVGGSILVIHTRDKVKDGEWEKINEIIGNINLFQFMGYRIPI
jgi:hypothetical protein